MKEKLWKDCSKEEKHEVKLIEREIKDLKDDFKSGRIDEEQYNQKKKKILKKIDEVEKKYDV